MMDGMRGLPNSFISKSAPLFGIAGAIPSYCQPKHTNQAD